jgi:hypothetical protein
MYLGATFYPWPFFSLCLHLFLHLSLFLCFLVPIRGPALLYNMIPIMAFFLTIAQNWDTSSQSLGLTYHIYKLGTVIAPFSWDFWELNVLVSRNTWCIAHGGAWKFVTLKAYSSCQNAHRIYFMWYLMRVTSKESSTITQLESLSKSNHFSEVPTFL